MPIDDKASKDKKLAQVGWLLVAYRKQHGECTCDLCRKYELLTLARPKDPDEPLDPEYEKMIEKFIWE